MDIKGLHQDQVMLQRGEGGFSFTCGSKSWLPGTTQDLDLIGRRSLHSAYLNPLPSVFGQPTRSDLVNIDQTEEPMMSLSKSAASCDLLLKVVERFASLT